VRRIASAVYGVSVLVAASLLALTMGIVLVLPHAWRPRGERERYTMPGAVRWAGIVLDHLLRVRVRVSGTPLAPDDPRGMIVLCNHRSWLDPLLLMRHARSNGLSKSAVAWMPFIGLMGGLTGAVYFDRSDPHARQRARSEVLRLVRGGHRIQVFPEGTRTRGQRIGERAHLTLAMDCHRHGIPVLCCSVWRTDSVLPPGFFGAWWDREVDLRFGPVMEPRDWPDPRSFAEACWAEVVAGVNVLADAQSTTSSPSASA
jgi:1-acyl-sn-glycerol-3-phosphate acyltransferase